MRLVLTIFLYFSSFSIIVSQENVQSSVLDSVIYYRNKSKDNSLPLKDRLKLAQKASSLSSNLNIDTTTILNNRNLSYLYLILEDFEPFKNVNYENLQVVRLYRELKNKIKQRLVV